MTNSHVGYMAVLRQLAFLSKSWTGDRLIIIITY